MLNKKRASVLRRPFLDTRTVFKKVRDKEPKSRRKYSKTNV